MIATEKRLWMMANDGDGWGAADTESENTDE
jgi:hypothetical protein